MTRTIDVVHSPWCLIEAPGEAYVTMLAETHDVAIRAFNLWDIGDEDLAALPERVAAVIGKARDQSIPEYEWHGGGSLFSPDGERLALPPALRRPRVARRVGLKTLPGDECLDETVVYVCM